MGRLTHKNSKRNATFVQSWDYQYDAMNNIKSRVDNISLQGENFTYDNLNRLLDVYQGPLNQQFIGLVQSMNYDNLGNMTHKTDVGDMQYSTTHPFQMETLTENPQTITSEHVLEYFVSGRTKTIVNNDDKLQFTYGSDLQRRKMEYFLEDQLQSTTLYPFGNYEEVHNATTNDVLKYNYIGSPDGLIAIRKTINGTSQLYYVLTDHLGSIDALCNTSGDVVERYSYDAWGNRRNPTDWSQADTRTTWITTRGFTGHEHLDKFGLINANARMYEPLTGKFLAPDPFVQNPSNSQNYNRFSYVLNNPLKYVDPSGYMVWDPWFETMINGNRFFKEFPEMFENFRDKNGNLWKLRDDIKFSDENGNVFLRKIDEGLYVEITKYQEIQEKLRQYNSLFRDANIGFIAGAGVFRVEGEGNGINQGEDFSLAKMYLHFQIGGGKPLIIKTNTIDFKNATQKKLGLSGIQKGDVKQVNLFDLEVNSTSLAFGKIDMKYLGDNKFSIMPNYFDFNIEWEAGYSSRNVGTVIGGSINYNLMINPAAAIVPLIFGGPYEVIFYGTITIPE